MASRPLSRDLAGCWTCPCIAPPRSGACAPVNIFCPAVPSRRLQQRRPWAMLRCASGLGLIARLTLQVSGLVAHTAAAHLIGAAALASARAAAAPGLRVRRPSRVRWRRCRRGSRGRGAGRSRRGRARADDAHGRTAAAAAQRGAFGLCLGPGLRHLEDQQLQQRCQPAGIRMQEAPAAGAPQPLGQYRLQHQAQELAHRRPFVAARRQSCCRASASSASCRRRPRCCTAR